MGEERSSAAERRVEHAVQRIRRCLDEHGFRRGLDVLDKSLIVAPSRDPILKFYPVRRFLAGIVPATLNRLPIGRRLALAGDRAKIVRNF